MGACRFVAKWPRGILYFRIFIQRAPIRRAQLLFTGSQAGNSFDFGPTTILRQTAAAAYDNIGFVKSARTG